MKALLCKQFGPPDTLVVEDIPELVPDENGAVIRVHAAGVNFPDALLIQDKYQFKPALPFSPGGECAGVVEAVGGNVRHIRAGARVLAFTTYGAFAEQVACDARTLIPMPTELDFVTGAAFVLTYATSYHALVDRGAVKAGDVVLVLGASGGVGIAAIEIAKALGATVIAAASSAAKLEVCKEHGADHLIDYGKDDLRTRIKQITDGKGVDIVYDPVGGAYTEAALRSIAWRGRLLVVGFAAGEIPKIPANLTLLKGASIVGVFWGEFTRREPRNFADELRVLGSWYAQGKLKPHISMRFPLEKGPEAMNALLSRKATGKVVLTVA